MLPMCLECIFLAKNNMTCAWKRTTEAPLGGAAWPIPGTIEAEKYWQNWTTVSVTTASLSAGQHLRVFFDTGGCNLNWISL